LFVVLDFEPVRTTTDSENLFGGLCGDHCFGVGFSSSPLSWGSSFLVYAALASYTAVRRATDP
jgi:hypothetical protein